jgi:hypothetical protein
MVYEGGRMVDIPNQRRGLLAFEQISESACVTQAVSGLAAVMDE